MAFNFEEWCYVNTRALLTNEQVSSLAEQLSGSKSVSQQQLENMVSEVTEDEKIDTRKQKAKKQIQQDFKQLDKKLEQEKQKPQIRDFANHFWNNFKQSYDRDSFDPYDYNPRNMQQFESMLNDLQKAVKKDIDKKQTRRNQQNPVSQNQTQNRQTSFQQNQPYNPQQNPNFQQSPTKQSNNPAQQSSQSSPAQQSQPSTPRQQSSNSQQYQPGNSQNSQFNNLQTSTGNSASQNSIYSIQNPEQETTETTSTQIANKAIEEARQRAIGQYMQETERHYDRQKQGILENFQYEFDLNNDELRQLERDLQSSEFEEKLKRETEQAEKRKQEYVEQILEKGLVSRERERFEVNKENIVYCLAKKAFDKIREKLKGKRENKIGSHKSEAIGLGEIKLDRTTKTQRLTRNVAVLPTLRNSIKRRALSSGSILEDEDLVEYDTSKNIQYSVVLAIDRSNSMNYGRMEAAKNAMLSFAYYLKKHHKKDRVKFLAFDDRVEEIQFEDIPRLSGRGWTHTADCLERAIELFEKDKKREKVLYLITDGLPEIEYGGSEAYREKTVKTASKLPDKKISFAEVFIDTGSGREFEYWGGKIADAGKGLMFKIHSENLGTFLIEDYRARRK